MECWEDVDILPCYFVIESGEPLDDLVDASISRVLHDSGSWEERRVRKQDIDRGNGEINHGLNVLTKLVSLLEGFDHARLLVLSDSKALLHCGLHIREDRPKSCLWHVSGQPKACWLLEWERISRCSFRCIVFNL